MRKLCMRLIRRIGAALRWLWEASCLEVPPGEPMPPRRREDGIPEINPYTGLPYASGPGVDIQGNALTRRDPPKPSTHR